MIGNKTYSEDKQQIQLYNLFNSMSSYVQNQDQTGIFVSYGIIEGLFSFQTTIGSNISKKINQETIRQIKFEEVRTIYKKLDTILADISNKGVNDTFQNINSHVDSLLQKTLSEQNFKTNPKSVLLMNIVDNLGNNKNYKDKLRRNGLKLLNEVKYKKPFFRKYDCLTQDYKSIENAFVEKNIFEYEKFLELIRRR